MLMEMKHRIESIHNSQLRSLTNEQVIVLQGLYKYFIYLPRLSSTTYKIAISSNNYWTSLLQNPLYVLHGIGYKPLKEGVLLPTVSFNNKAITSYVLSVVPLSLCPLQIANDLLNVVLPSNSTNILTPSLLRIAFISKSSIHCQALKNKEQIVKALLDYVLIDISMQSLEFESEHVQRRVYRELGGCPLMPLADKTIKPFPRNASDQVAIAPIILHLLLPLLKSSFLHPTLLNDLKIFDNTIFLDSLFISKFSIAFIDKHISHIIPTNLKFVQAVCWLNSEPTTHNNTTTVGFFSRMINRGSSITPTANSLPNNRNNHLSTIATNLPSPLLIYVLWNDYLGNHHLILLPCKDRCINYSQNAI